jgi:colanic acid/amylovoran biosynthesis glycosyltransferase
MVRLAVVPSLPVSFVSAHQVRLTQKFVEGMAQYCSLWPGAVVAVMHPDNNSATQNLDDRTFELDQLPFEVRAASFENAELFAALQDCDVVMLGGDHRHPSLTRWCMAQGKRTVFVAEYSLQTRFDIIKAAVGNPVVRLRRYIWEYLEEVKNRHNVTIADAVQCNGVPTFVQYSKLNANTMCFFDSRVTEDMIPGAPTVAARAELLKHGRPISLAYSGRLSAMKGVEDLVEVAVQLQRKGIPFQMEIFGDGPLRSLLARQIQLSGLEDAVFLRGVLEFSKELMPHMRDHVDLFVCCHPQGDPSCTYLETLSCGVPIVGYSNEALRGLIADHQMGWITPLNDPGRLAAKIGEIYSDSTVLVAAGRNALDFARQHTFPVEFKARIEQIKVLLEHAPRPSSRRRWAGSAGW